MTRDLELLADANREKARRTIDLVAASLSEYQPFDPVATYTPKALEPYDALADRFVRAVECCLRYFRSHELLEFAEQSDSTRIEDIGREHPGEGAGQIGRRRGLAGQAVGPAKAESDDKGDHQTDQDRPDDF